MCYSVNVGVIYEESSALYVKPAAPQQHKGKKLMFLIVCERPLWVLHSLLFGFISMNLLRDCTQSVCNFHTLEHDPTLPGCVHMFTDLDRGYSLFKE